MIEHPFFKKQSLIVCIIIAALLCATALFIHSYYLLTSLCVATAFGGFILINQCDKTSLTFPANKPLSACEIQQWTGGQDHTCGCLRAWDEALRQPQFNPDSDSLVQLWLQSCQQMMANNPDAQIPAAYLDYLRRHLSLNQVNGYQGRLSHAINACLQTLYHPQPSAPPLTAPIEYRPHP